MLKSANEIISYFEKLYANKAVYLWGANSEIITPSLCDKLFKTYGNTTYNKAYYDNKLKEGQGRIGADCSGAMFPMSGFDTTAQNYYNKCTEKGLIISIPRDKPCLVFKGSSLSSINHIGFYCGNGYVIEMKSSKDNCVKNILDYGGWKWYGVPTWINYTSTSVNTTSQKCIDVSSYQGNIKWEQVKAAGVNKTILKVIRKDLKPDKKFEEYYSGCKSANIEVIGVYNYSYATTSAKAKTDAQKVLSILNGRKVKVWLDVEDKCQQGIGSLLKDIINTYQNVIESAGYEFGVYTGMSFYQSYIKPYENQIKCKDWWIARYYNGYNKMNVSVNPNESYNPKSTIGRDIYGWQYTSSGQVSGINGNVDMNIIYKLSNNSNDNNSNSNSSSSTFSEFLGKITASSLNIRSGASAAYSRVGSYAKGSVVHIIGQASNGWYQTDKGYISNEYVKQLIGQVYNCGGLNVRSTPDSSKDNVIKSLKPSDEIALLFDNGSWYKCKLNNGTVGWVSKKYIRIL